MASPPFFTNYSSGSLDWDRSANSGATYVTPATNSQQVIGPVGTERYRQIFTIPEGYYGNWTVTVSGDIFDNSVNTNAQVHYDAVFQGNVVPLGGPTTFTFPMTPGTHTFELWIGGSDSQGAGNLTAPVITASFVEVHPNLTTCCCTAYPPLQKCYFDGSAARIATFDSAQLTANPNGFGVAGIPNMVNGNYSGLAACTVNVPAPPADNGMVFDFTYTIPWDRVTAVRITTNFGNILNDGDNIFNPDAQLFDALGAPLTPVFTALADNGGAFFVTPVPGGPIDGVARLRLTNIRGNFGGGTKGIREVELLVGGIGPAALLYCPSNDTPISWVDPRNGNPVSFADLTTCRFAPST